MFYQYMFIIEKQKSKEDLERFKKTIRMRKRLQFGLKYGKIAHGKWWEVATKDKNVASFYV